MLLFVTLFMAVVLMLPGCATVREAAQQALEKRALEEGVSPDDIETIKDLAGHFGKFIENLTPENEYYLGRSVAATLFSKYPPYENAEANRYSYLRMRIWRI